MLEECPAAAFDFRGRSLGVAPYKVSDSPSLIEFIEKSDRMIRFVVREHVPQCFMWVAYHEGYLGQTLKVDHFIYKNAELNGFIVISLFFNIISSSSLLFPSPFFLFLSLIRIKISTSTLKECPDSILLILCGSNPFQTSMLLIQTNLFRFIKYATKFISLSAILFNIHIFLSTFPI